MRDQGADLNGVEGEGEWTEPFYFQRIGFIAELTDVGHRGAAELAEDLVKGGGGYWRKNVVKYGGEDAGAKLVSGSGTMVQQPVAKVGRA